VIGRRVAGAADVVGGLFPLFIRLCCHEVAA